MLIRDAIQADLPAITAIICRKPAASARAINSATSALPTPWPRTSSRT